MLFEHEDDARTSIPKIRASFQKRYLESAPRYKKGRKVSPDDQDLLVLFLMPAAVGGARAEAVPVDVGALGTSVAACEDDPPLAILLLVLLEAAVGQLPFVL